MKEDMYENKILTSADILEHADKLQVVLASQPDMVYDVQFASLGFSDDLSDEENDALIGDFTITLVNGKTYRVKDQPITFGEKLEISEKIISDYTREDISMVTAECGERIALIPWLMMPVGMYELSARKEIGWTNDF